MLDAATATTLQPWFPSLALSKVRIVEAGPVCWFVRNVLRQGAMTFSPFIFFGRDTWDGASLVSIALLAHELRHIEQYRERGHVMFLARYFRDLARNRFRYSRDLPLEAECYALQARVEEALRARFS